MKKILSFVLAFALSASVFAGGLSGPGNYKAAAVAITGGTINGTTVGATTSAAGTFSVLTSPQVAITGGGITGAIINGGTIGAQSNVSTGGFVDLYYSTLRSGTAGNPVTFSTTAPTIASGFCTSPSIAFANGTAAFVINVGSACATFQGTITMPAAVNGWSCMLHENTFYTNALLHIEGMTTTSILIQKKLVSTGGAVNFVSGWQIFVNCVGY